MKTIKQKLFELFEHYFPVTLYKDWSIRNGVLTPCCQGQGGHGDTNVQSNSKMWQSCQMEASEQHHLSVLFITLYKVDLIFEFVVEILNCENSSESY